MSTPTIWEALNSGNLQLLTEVLQQVNFNTHPRDTARLLIETNQRRKTVVKVYDGGEWSQAQDRIIALEQLAKDLYYAINDVYENVEQCVDADLVGDAYRSNWAGNAIERWKPLLERAQGVLGLKK